MQKRGLYVTLFILFAGLAYSACPPPGAPTHDTLYVNTLKPIGGDCESPISIQAKLNIQKEFTVANGVMAFLYGGITIDSGDYIRSTDDRVRFLDHIDATGYNIYAANIIANSVSGDVSCTGCIGSAEIQNSGVGSVDVNFNYASGRTKGGPANTAYYAP